jgi:hypothetical protein
MSNRISVAKIGKSMSHFEKSIKYINRKIDERSQNGKFNENDADRHYSGTSDDGSRCWSY